MIDTEVPAEHPEAVLARNRLSALSPIVFEALELGIERGREHFVERPLDPWLFPHIVRDSAIERLKSREAAAGFSVHRMPMAGIDVRCAGYVLRVFKRCGADSDDALYPAGRSEGRQDFYRQMVVPGTEHLMAPASSRNLVYVWEVVGSDLELCLVCPDGYEDIWKPGRSRWSIPIPHPALNMDPEQDFAEDDDELPIHHDEAASGPETET